MAELSSVKCEINIYGAKNIVTKKQGSLFIRSYLCVGKNNKRVQLNTRETMSSKKDGDEPVFWNETFSMECSGATNDDVKAGKLELELRWRSASTNVLGQKSSSKVLARGEIIINKVLVDDEPVVVGTTSSWVAMVRNNKECWDVKPPALQVGVKLEEEEEKKAKTVSREEMRRRRRQERLRNWDECGCGCSNNGVGFCGCVDNDLFLLAAVVDVC